MRARIIVEKVTMALLNNFPPFFNWSMSTDMTLDWMILKFRINLRLPQFNYYVGNVDVYYDRTKQKQKLKQIKIIGFCNKKNGK